MGRRSGGAGVAGCLVLLTAGEAGAAAFALKEQSATAQGNAFAGATAGAEDASFMFFNPAAIGRLDGPEVQGVVNVLMPRAKLHGASATTILGTPIGGRDQIDDVEDNAVVPALYAVLPLGERWRAGLAVNAPFGLETSYQHDWVGRYYGLTSKLKTVNINPVVAWRATDWLILGGGFQAQYADAELTQAIDFGTIGATVGIPGAVPGGQDGFARTKGTDWAWGYNLGLLVEPLAGTRLGLAFRSGIDHTLRGTTDFTLDSAGIGSIIAGATGAFQDTRDTAAFDTPAMVSVGLHQELGERFAVMGELAWTRWSVFDELRVEFDNPAQPPSVTEEKWNDVWFAAVGGTWRASDTLTLRAGIAYDQSPTTDKYRTPRIPDQDRSWVSLGLGWRPTGWLTLDASVSHLFVKDSDVDLKASDTGNGFRGNLEARYDNMIDLIALSGRVRF
jgi:long-chain fatty acid transport protein